MIQRIQSIYLLLTTLLSVLFLKVDIIRFIDVSNNFLIINFGGITRTIKGEGTEQIEKLIPLSGLLLLIPIISFVTIFLYKNRKLQIRFAGALIVIIAIMIFTGAYYAFDVIRNFNSHMVPGLNLVFPVLIMIFTYLAYRGIKKDDDLVRSYDRLR